MHPDKSPGPDGMNPSFFQKHWDIVGASVVDSCLMFLNEGFLPNGINDTLICLIPKKNNPEKMGDLRPISLCNVIYKVVSKVIANRLKDVLPNVISEFQSAFLPGRMITNNVMLAFKISHFLKRKRQGKHGTTALKLDMSEAYDRVEWTFVEHMLLKLGFSDRFVNLIMLCVTSMTYSVCGNGKEIGPITPRRGLRQGDPLSPYLFLICAEGLSCLLQKETSRGRIHGCSIARSAPMINHLFFANDSFLFFRADEEESTCIKNYLNDYALASGKIVNFDKSSVSFSSNMISSNRRAVCSILHVNETDNHGSHWGCRLLLAEIDMVFFLLLKKEHGRGYRVGGINCSLELAKRCSLNQLFNRFHLM